jgi:hypothetical protein
MTFLQFHYVVDDATLKQNTYCAGTAIPVKPIAELTRHDTTKPLTIVVFAWNFEAEIVNKIIQMLQPTDMKKVHILLPFPTQQLMQVDVATGERRVLLENPAMAVPYPHPFPLFQPPLVLVATFREGLALLPFFIQHHVSIFDRIVMVDIGRGSNTVASLQIIRDLAPSTVRVVQEEANMDDVLECRYGCWRVDVTLLEFVVHPNLRRALSRLPRSLASAQLPVLAMAAWDDSSDLKRFTPLLEQHTHLIQDRPVDQKLIRRVGESVQMNSEGEVQQIGGFIARFPPPGSGTGQTIAIDLRMVPSSSESFQQDWYRTIQGTPILE